jgi:hypothetical protein
LRVLRGLKTPARIQKFVDGLEYQYGDTAWSPQRVLLERKGHCLEGALLAAIKFGTSGWRAIVADEFTVANIRLAVAGIAAYVKTQPEPHRVLVGRDPAVSGRELCGRGGAGAGRGRGDADCDSRGRADAGDCLCRADAEDLGGHQLYRFAQSAGVQRHQVFHARRRTGAAGGDKQIEAAIADSATGGISQGNASGGRV